jgi:AraC-like DNA-binding protein
MLALKAGFSDQGHFTRSFKRRTSLPPGKYRRAHRSTLGRLS